MKWISIYFRFSRKFRRDFIFVFSFLIYCKIIHNKQTSQIETKINSPHKKELRIQKQHSFLHFLSLFLFIYFLKSFFLLLLISIQQKNNTTKKRSLTINNFCFTNTNQTTTTSIVYQRNKEGDEYNQTTTENRWQQAKSYLEVQITFPSS